MPRQPLTLHAATPEQTSGIARSLGAILQPGDVILLEGDVGAGKTHFARSLIQSLLRHPEDVPSPTFTLVQTYDAVPAEIWHADLYRLTSVREIDELGLTEAFDVAICLVEWPDRLGPLGPAHALTLALRPGDGENARVITAHWTDAKWNDRLAQVAA